MGGVGTCRLYSVYSVGSECVAGGEGEGVLGSWADVGILGVEWARWGGELVYLVSVGVECVCVKGSLVLV